MKFHLIVMASGAGRRFGGNKLLATYQGKALYLHAIDKLQALAGKREDIGTFIVVTRHEEIIEELKRRGIDYKRNDQSDKGITASIHIGINAASEPEPEDAYVFFVADQPGLTTESVDGLLDFYKIAGKGMACTIAEGRIGNPVVFSARYVPELLAITGDKGGKQVLRRHPEDVAYYEVRPEELLDVDSKEDMSR